MKPIAQPPSIPQNRGHHFRHLPMPLLGIGLGGITACQPIPPPQNSVTDRPNLNLQGNIVIDGSSTVFPITEAMAEAFRRQAIKVKTTVAVSGSGGGFKKFCANQTDINNASRPIKAKEIAACNQAGIEYVELPIAFDALTVVINPKNKWAGCLTVAQLQKMWQPEAENKVTNWQQIAPQFPSQPLRLYGPGKDSGTFDYFTDAINGKEDQSRQDYTASEDDNIAVQGVIDDPGALGYLGFSYLEANRDQLKAVQIDDGDPKNGNGCIAPAAHTVLDGTYQPLSRPLFVYVNKASLAKPEVKAFMEFYLADENHTLVRDAGYIPLGDSTYKKIQDRLKQQTTGTVFPGGTTVGVKIDDVI